MSSSAKSNFFLYSIILFALAACSGTREQYGYSIKQQLISPDSAKTIKSGIRQLSNEPYPAYRYTGTADSTLSYRLMRPEHIQTQKKYPLVLVLHSSGGIGNNNTGQLEVLAKLWSTPGFRKKYPAWVLVPQFPRRSANYVQDPKTGVLASTSDPCLETALQLLDSLKNALPIDPARVYVLGFSMGGSATINAIGLRPGLFAAAISASGIPAFNQTRVLAQTPIWFIHGNADRENPFGSDSLLYRTLSGLHAPRIRFWEVQGMDHEIYSGLFTSEEIPRWLFRHRRQNIPD